MPLSSEDWIKALSHVTEAEQLKVTVKSSFLGSAFVAVVCMVMSLLLGPVGLLFGGIVGGCIGFFKFQGSYKSVSSVLKELDPKQREALFNDLAAVRDNITAADYVELILLLQGGGALLFKKQILDILVNFFKNELKANINLP